MKALIKSCVILAFCFCAGCYKKVEKVERVQAPADKIVIEERRQVPEVTTRERIIERRSENFDLPVERRRSVTTDTTVIR